MLIGRLTRIQNGRRRSEKRKHVKFLVKQTVYKDFMEENQPQKVNSKSINTISIGIMRWRVQLGINSMGVPISIGNHAMASTIRD